MCIHTIKTYSCGYESRRYKKTGSECYLDPLPKNHPKTARCIEIYSACGPCYTEQLQGRFHETCIHSKKIQVSWEEDFFTFNARESKDSGGKIDSGIRKGGDGKPGVVN